MAKGSAFVPHDLARPIAGTPGGLLSGLSAAVKDMFDIRGERTGGGSPEWLAASSPAEDTSATVSRLLDAGATVAGKTICDEFFYSVTGANAHYGTPVNPRAPGRLPGGSSSGSAVATAAGACDFAIGSDTGGSVRIPAALCGVYGIRPTHGRVDSRGAMAMAPSFDVVGWFAPGPGLLRRPGRVLLDGPSVISPVKRVLRPRDLFGVIDTGVLQVFDSFLQRVGGDFPVHDDVDLCSGKYEVWVDCFRTIQGYEIWQVYGDWVTEHRPNLGPGIRERMSYAATVMPDQVQRARARRSSIRASLQEILVPGTVLLMPTAPCIAPVVTASAEVVNEYRSRTMALTSIAGLGGLPQVTMPIGTCDGAPVGASLIGWPGGDETLLDVVVRLAPFASP